MSTALRENAGNILKGTLCLIAIAGLHFSFPFLVKLMIDRLQARPWPEWIPPYWSQLSTGPSILVLCFFYLGLAGVLAYGRYWWRVFFIWTSFPIFHQMRMRLFAHLHNLPLEFFKKHRVGNLISALSNDTENMRMSVSIGALMFVDAMINFTFFPIILYLLNPSMTLAIIPCFFVIAIFAMVWSGKLSSRYEKVQEVTAELSAKTFEISSGVRVIKAFRREADIHREFLKKSEELRQASVGVAKFQSFFVPGLDLALNIGLVAVLFYGGAQVIEGKMPLSNFVAFSLYLAQMDWPMMALGWFIQMYRSGKAGEQRLRQFAEIESPLQKQTGLRRLPYDAQTEFRLENVGIQFENQKQALFENLTLQLPAKQWVGLTGPVGSGKTVFLELLSRQRDPSKGSIFFRGEDLRSLDPREVQSDILYVPQESFLFSRSIRKNLTLGLKNPPSDEELWELLNELSFNRGLLENRGGLFTRLGEKGVSLSGGQKQRLSLGRALLRKRSVYLFDDLFSHVDAETEAKLVQLLRQRLPADALVVLASQRIQTLFECASLLVLKKGGLDYFGPSRRSSQESSFIRELTEIQQTQDVQNKVAT